jgi:TolB-like protein/Flp pilus assembly protein TadD
MESLDAVRSLKFGAFELDMRLRELRSGTTRIRLQEQPFEILRLMLERPGDVVTREQLRRRLWPDGTYVDFEHSLNAAVKRLRAALGDDADNPRFVETLPRRGYRFIAPLGTAVPPAAVAPPPSPSRVRLAVLPFSNLSDDPAQEYFSDGLTEEMITQLGVLCRGRIGIIARWSSMVFKGTTRRAREIGETLQADFLLEGSVRREGDRARITARLVETAGETHLWSDTYERHLGDCLVVQADVAAHIARALAMELLPGPRVLQPACDPAAYQAYLKGRYYWNKPSDGGLTEAIAFYERAIATTPTFGAAHAALGRALLGRAEFYRELPRQALKAAEASAKRALELDRTLSEAWVVMAGVRRHHDLDWPAAESAYTEAISLNPSSEAAHRHYSVMLSARGRHAEAIRESERSCELDPLCLDVGTAAAWVRYAAGDYDAAIDQCRNTIDMDPEYLAARRLLGAAYLQSNREAEALAELQSAATLGDDDPLVLACLAHAKAVTGSPREATALIVRMRRLAAERYVSAYYLALAYAGLGSRDDAFRALEQAWLDRDPALAFVCVEPRFEPLRTDDRYAALLNRMKKEEE